MNYINLAFKLSQFYKKSKKKYEKILKSKKDEFPSFLSTRHFYKRRKGFFLNEKIINNIRPLNISSAKKQESKLMLSKKESKRNSKETQRNLSKYSDSFSSNNFLLDSKNNSGNKTKNSNKKKLKNIYKTSLSVENKKNRKKELTPEDKIKIKNILSNFQKNKLTTNNLYKLEEKQNLNSLTESNFLFLFTNYKNNYSHKKRMKQLLYNKTTIESMPKSSLISFNMMKKFNDKTYNIFREKKIEGIQFSKNINQFRKQIINSYKDSFSKNDISQEKLNYNNAINFLNTNQEKQIKKAFELEKEFYKTKYNKNENKYNNTPQKKEHIDSYVERKVKKNSTNKFSVNSLLSKNDNNSVKTFSLSKDKDVNNKEDEKIFDYNHANKESKSYSNYIKNNLVNHNNKHFIESINRTSKDIPRYSKNNIYLNYMKNIKQRKSKKKSGNEEYKDYIKETLKNRAKQFADSLASLNYYFEYQPLRFINSDNPDLNVNPINLKRVAKVNEINKNLYAYDDDDLLLHNVKKLKEKLKDVELEYYSIDKYETKYKLSFLKKDVRRKTIEKINAIKNPKFGIPC